MKTQLSLHFLLLNSDKAEMLVVGSVRHKHQFDRVTVTLDNCVISQSVAAENLGVAFDRGFSLMSKASNKSQTLTFIPLMYN